MSLAVFNGAAFTSASGLAIAGNATVEVRRESDSGIAAIFSDEAGLVPITNPSAFVDADGRFAFYAAGIAGGYSIMVTKGAESHTIRNVAIGTAAQLDTPVDTQAIFDASVLFMPMNDLGFGVCNLTPARGTQLKTFVRATIAHTILSNGDWGLVASGSPRSYYKPDGTYRGYLGEPASTNLCLQSQDFSLTWANVGTPTLSANTTVLGALSLSTVGDDAAGTLEGKTQPITFTGDANKALSTFVKKGTSTSTAFRLRDTTAGANRLLGTITWSGTVPVVTMTTGADLTGTPEQYAASGVYRISVKAAGVIAANVNSLEFYPATDAALTVGGTGTIEIGGWQAENALAESSYIPTTTTTVTRNADNPNLDPPISMPASFYCEHTKLSANLDVLTKHLVLSATQNDSDGFGLVRNEASATATLMAVGKRATVATAQVELGTFTLGTTAKCAGVFAENRVNVFKDGVAGTQDSAVALPLGVQNINVGANYVGGQSMSGCLKNVHVWDTDLSDSDALAIVS